MHNKQKNEYKIRKLKKQIRQKNKVTLNNTRGRLTNLELALNAALAPFPVVYLTCVVIIHDLDKLTRQRRMLETHVSVVECHTNKTVCNSLLAS